MSTTVSPIALAVCDTAASPAWHNFAVPVFGGRESHIQTGEPYATMRLADLFAMPPAAHPKIDSLAFIPSTYREYDARAHAIQQERGAYVTLTGDIDAGDHALKAVEAVVRDFAGNAAWSIYSSASSRPGDRRWRAVIPLRAPVDFQTWHAAQTVLHDEFACAGIVPDRTLARAGQIVFAPNVPAVHDKSGAHLREGGAVDGAPLYFESSRSGMTAPGLDLDRCGSALEILERIEDNQADDARRRAAADEAKAKRAERAGSGFTPIERFNEAHDLADLLVKYGYAGSPSNGADWRSPHQESGSYATRVSADDDDRQWWCSLSGSDREAGIGRECASGCHGDAFDLFAHYEHGGDRDAALAALRASEAAHAFDGVDVPLPEHKADAVSGASTPSGASRFRLLSLDDLEHEVPRKPIIKGLVGRGDFGCIFGQPGAGKSVVAPYLALRVAQGLLAFGMKTVAGPVIYVSAEDPHGMGKRLRAARRVYGDVVSLHLATGLAGMMADIKSAEMQDLLRSIDERQPILVIIDTLAVGFSIDEITSLGMGTVVKICRMIADRGPAVLVIHHPPKADSSTPRGHGSLNGALDMSLRVDPADTSGVIRCTSMKNRNGFPRRFGFKIRSELIGHDEDGDPITAPVCEEFDLRNLPKDAKLSGAKLDALAVLDDLASGGDRVAMADWRARCIMPGVLSESVVAKFRADTFGRAKRELLRAGLITILVDGASEWVAQKSDLENLGPVEIPDF
jgi:hypothetical protein